MSQVSFSRMCSRYTNACMLIMSDIILGVAVQECVVLTRAFDRVVANGVSCDEFCMSGICGI